MTPKTQELLDRLHSKTLSLRVTGVSFRTVESNESEHVPLAYPHNVNRIADLLEDPQAVLVVKLVREPDNEFDSNAIQVHVVELEKEGASFVGYIPAAQNAALAEILDKNLTQVVSWVKRVARQYGEDRQLPGLDIYITSAELAKGTCSEVLLDALYLGF